MLFVESENFHDAFSSYVSDMWQLIWWANVLPRVKVFAWRVCHEALPTLLGLIHQVPNFVVICCTCRLANDSYVY